MFNQNKKKKLGVEHSGTLGHNKKSNPTYTSQVQKQGEKLQVKATENTLTKS